jgi:hypothetical protein
MASRAGIVAAATAASSCPRRPPPNSRAVSPHTTTVAHAASAGHIRSPGSDTPNSFRDTHASSGVSTAKTMPPTPITHRLNGLVPVTAAAAVMAGRRPLMTELARECARP